MVRYDSLYEVDGLQVWKDLDGEEWRGLDRQAWKDLDGQL